MQKRRHSEKAIEDRTGFSYDNAHQKPARDRKRKQWQDRGMRMTDGVPIPANHEWYESERDNFTTSEAMAKTNCESFLADLGVLGGVTHALSIAASANSTHGRDIDYFAGVQLPFSAPSTKRSTASRTARSSTLPFSVES